MGLQAAGADIFTNLTAVFKKCRLLNIGFELALGMLHREADVMPELWPLATYFAFSHNFTYLTN
jgi:hypothetical protein